MVAGAAGKYFYIRRLFPGADDTYFDRQKNTTGEGNTIQIAWRCLLYWSASSLLFFSSPGEK